MDFENGVGGGEHGGVGVKKGRCRGRFGNGGAKELPLHVGELYKVGFDQRSVQA